MKVKTVTHDGRLFALVFAAYEDEGGDEIYRGRNVLMRVSTPENGDFVVKRFRRPFFLQSVVYTLLRPSKAARSYLNALRLGQLGIGTPQPLGYREDYSTGILGDSYYVCRFLDGYEHIRSLMNEEIEHDGLLCAVVDFIVSLHRAGVRHIDLSPGNLLYREDTAASTYDFGLVDLNRMKFGTMSSRQRFRNLGRLALGRGMTRRIAHLYAEHTGENVQEAEREALSTGDKFFNRKMRKEYVRSAYRAGGWAACIKAAGLLISFYSLLLLSRITTSVSCLTQARDLYERALRCHDHRGFYFDLFSARLDG